MLREFECADSAQVNAAVARARIAQPSWRATPVGDRLAILKRFQSLLNDRKTQVARTITSEAGKPVAEALLTEVLVVLDAARFLLQTAHSFLRDEPVPHGSLATKAKRGCIVREPYGVVGNHLAMELSVFNSSHADSCRVDRGKRSCVETFGIDAVVVARIGRNCSRTPACPARCFQILVGDGATGAALVDSAIDKLVFTGSEGTGKRIAAKRRRSSAAGVLELGGKDPMIVLEDADIDVASSGAVWGAFVNAGQACLSVERCYVHRSVYDKFVAACVEKTKQLRVGNGMQPDTEVGPLIHERQLRIVEQHVEDARSRGARVLCGGQRLTSLGTNFYAPTVIADVTHEMLIMREETFGPVLPIMAFDSEAEAVRLANDSEFGLAASVWTQNRARGETIARQLKPVRS